MPVRARCPNPNCRKSFHVPEHYLGRSARCTRCRRSFLVTMEADAASGETASESGPNPELAVSEEVASSALLQGESGGDGSLPVLGPVESVSGESNEESSAPPAPSEPAAAGESPPPPPRHRKRDLVLAAAAVFLGLVAGGFLAEWVLGEAGTVEPPPNLTQTKPPTEGLKPPLAVRLLPIPDVTLKAGETLRLAIQVERYGCEGPVDLVIEDLPKELTGKSNTIPTDEGAAEIELTADGDAATLTREIKLTARSGELSDTRTVTITIERVPALRLEPIAGVALKPGENRAIEVRIQRRGYEGAVQIEVQGLPDQVTAKAAPIAADQDTARVELSAAADAKEIERELRLSVRGGELTATELVKLRVLKLLPFELLPISEIVLVPGQPKEFAVRVKRNEPKGLIHVFLENVPGHLSANSGAIPPGKDEVVLELTPGGGGFGATALPRGRARGRNVGANAMRVRARLGDYTTEADVAVTVKTTELRQLAGHTDIVMSVSPSPDGRLVASGSRDRSLRLWDVDTGEALQILQGHNDDVMTVTFSPDGAHVLSGGGDATLRLWDVDTGEQVRTFTGHGRLINCVVFSPDGAQTASGSGDQTVRLWKIEDGKELRTFKGHAKYVTSVAFSPDGSRLASGSGDYTARIWDPKTGKETLRLAHADVVNCLAWSPDGKLLLTGTGSLHSPRCALYLWDAKSGRQLGFVWHKTQIQSVGFTPDGRRILFGSWDSTVRILDVETGEEVRRLEGYAGLVLSAGFFPDGQGIVFSGNNNTVFLWDAAGQELGPFEGHRGTVTSLHFSRDGSVLLSGSDDRTARLWDAQTGKELRRFEGHVRGVTCVALSPDGALVLTGAGPGDPAARLWDVKTAKQLGRFPGHPLGVQGGAFSKDGSLAITISTEGILRAWNAKTGQEVGRLATGGGSFSFSSDGNRLLSGGFIVGGIRLWDVAGGKEMGRLAAAGFGDALVGFTLDAAGQVQNAGDVRGRALPPWQMRRLAFSNLALSPDGRFAGLGGSRDKMVRLCDLTTVKELHRLLGHTHGVTSIAFSGDGQHAVTGANSPDGTLRLWDPQTGDLRRRLEWWNTHGVQCVAFTPDDRSVVAGGGNLRRGTIRLWPLDDNRYEVFPFARHARGIYRIAFTKDGARAVSAAGDHTLRLWEVSSGRELVRYEGHIGAVWNTAISPDGKTMLSAGADSTIRVWDTASGRELRRFDARALAVEEKSIDIPPIMPVVGGPALPAPVVQNTLRPLTSPKHQDHNLWLMDTKVVAVPPPVVQPPPPRPQPVQPPPAFPPVKQELRYLWPTVSRVQSVAFSNDSTKALIGHPNGILRLMDARIGREIRRFGTLEKGTQRVSMAPVDGVAFSADGKKVLSVSERRIQVWDATSGKKLGEFLLETDPPATGLQNVVFSPDGVRILAADGHDLRIWHLTSKKELHRLEGHTHEVLAVAFSPDGRRVLSTSADHTLRIWDAGTGWLVRSCEGHLREVWSASVSPDGRQVLSGGGPRESMLRLWEVNQ